MITKIILTGLICLSTVTSANANSNEQNKKTVMSFYELAFGQHKPEEAMNKYVGDKYIQHNPHVADGKKPFIDFFVPYFKKYPDARSEIKRSAAEGDLVFLHVNSKQSPKDLGRASIDIFRLENGKIVEHWDVNQPVPEKSANTNTMF